MRFKTFFTLCAMFMMLHTNGKPVEDNSRINLAGTWKFQIDRNGEGH